MTNQTANLIANAKRAASIGIDATDRRLVTIRAINRLKKSRNCSKLKSKWQNAIAALEAEYALL